MSQQDLLRRVLEVLDQAGIESMLTGSLASSLQGEPRSTHDIDLVIAVPRRPAEAAQTLARAFPAPDFHFDEQAALRAIASRAMFNLIDVRGGGRVDFWLLTDEPFDRSRFSRKVAEAAEGLEFKVSRPEDTVLMKLKWAAEAGGGERHFHDALRVYEVQHGMLDHAYLDRWAQTLGVTALLSRLRDEAEPLEE